MQDVTIQNHFRQSAPFWKNVYEQADVYATIHQERRDAVLAIVDSLRLAPATKVLDVGCGAGSISVPLALRGLTVKAVDAVPEMIALAKRAASDSGVCSNFDASLGDIRDLPFADNSFQLVLAIGVLPWLNEYDPSLRELVRVLKPGGYLLVNVDNCWGLHRLFDPITNVLFRPLRSAVGRSLRFAGLRKRERGISTSMVSIRHFNAVLRKHRVEPIQSRVLGFGPFCVFQREFLSVSSGVKLHRFLQRLSDRGFPVLSAMGSQYLVLATKDHETA